MKQTGDEDGFLGRWSRRKSADRVGQRLPEPTLAPPPTPPAQPPAATMVSTQLPDTKNAQAPEPEPEPPTLQDAQQLTPQSDFKPFMARNVSPDVKNTALKKLFADPHFNTMDMMDVYVDDYSKPDPLPASMLRQLASAQFLKLFDDEEKTVNNPAVRMTGDDADAQAVADVAQSQALTDTSPNASIQSPPGTPQVQPAPSHDNPDLQLQPDHAPGRKSPGQGTG